MTMFCPRSIFPVSGSAPGNPHANSRASPPQQHRKNVGAPCAPLPFVAAGPFKSSPGKFRPPGASPIMMSPPQSSSGAHIFSAGFPVRPFKASNLPPAGKSVIRRESSPPDVNMLPQVRINTASKINADRRSLLPNSIPEEDSEEPQLASVFRRTSNPLPQPKSHKTQQQLRQSDKFHTVPPAPGAIPIRRPIYQVTHTVPAPHTAGTSSLNALHYLVQNFNLRSSLPKFCMLKHQNLVTSKLSFVS